MDYFHNHANLNNVEHKRVKKQSSRHKMMENVLPEFRLLFVSQNGEFQKGKHVQSEVNQVKFLDELSICRPIRVRCQDLFLSTRASQFWREPVFIWEGHKGKNCRAWVDCKVEDPLANFSSFKLSGFALVLVAQTSVNVVVEGQTHWLFEDLIVLIKFYYVK